MSESIQLRFRSTHGDIGPFSFPDSTLLQAVKEKVFQEWPKEGDLAKEPPTSPNDLKLILSGKFVDATKPLKDYKKDMGELKPDTVVTMHMVVRLPSNQPKQSGGAGSAQEKRAPRGVVLSHNAVDTKQRCTSHESASERTATVQSSFFCTSNDYSQLCCDMPGQHWWQRI